MIENLLTIVLTLAFCVQAHAQLDAHAQRAALQIEGPREAGPGTLVRLSANTIEEESPFWIVLEPIDLDYEQVENGSRLLFSTGCKTGQRITVVLLAQQVRDGRIVTRQIRRTVLVKDSETDPDPIDDPPDSRPPKDDPLLPQSPLYAAVMEAWPSIQTDAAKALSESVAANIDSMAAKCEAGKIREKTEIWRELSLRNRRTLGVEASAWNPVANVLQQQFQNLALSTPAAHAVHLKATAAAIRAAFKHSENRSLR
jgi:hypothetical protein